MKELREFVELMDAIEAGNSVVQEEVTEQDVEQLNSILDQLDETLRQAVGLANDLARLGRNVPGPFAGQVRSYLEPHLESWLSDSRQPGSIPSLRNMLGGEEDDSYEN